MGVGLKIETSQGGYFFAVDLLIHILVYFCQEIRIGEYLIVINKDGIFAGIEYAGEAADVSHGRIIIQIQ